MRTDARLRALHGQYGPPARRSAHGSNTATWRSSRTRPPSETILEISVRGKRGVGYCKSMPGAVVPFERLKKRNKPAPTDRLFPKTHRELFNAILDEEGLKKDREGLPRTAYSLRHTYICLRLMEGADIYQIAKNCRTSVEMIEKFYAAHIKNMIDAAAVNVRRAATPAAPKEAAERPHPEGCRERKTPENPPEVREPAIRQHLLANANASHLKTTPDAATTTKRTSHGKTAQPRRFAKWALASRHSLAIDKAVCGCGGTGRRARLELGSLAWKRVSSQLSNSVNASVKRRCQPRAKPEQSGRCRDLTAAT